MITTNCWFRCLLSFLFTNKQDVSFVFRRSRQLILLVSACCLFSGHALSADHATLSFMSRPRDELPPSNVYNVIQIASPPQEFLLDSSEFFWKKGMQDGDADMTERLGLAPETARVKWVVPRRLVWVRWETCAEGTGRFIEEGHLMLLASGAEWIDVFRHQFEALVRSDNAEFETTKLTVSNQGGRMIVVRKTHDEQQTCEKPPRVWSHLERQTWRESTRQLATVRTAEERWYRIASGSLEYVSGRSVFETGKRTFQPGDLAEAFGVDVSALERRNSSLSRKRRWRGVVVLDDSLPDCRSSDNDEL